MPVFKINPVYSSCRLLYLRLEKIGTTCQILEINSLTAYTWSHFKVGIEILLLLLERFRYLASFNEVHTYEDMPIVREFKVSELSQDN